MRIRHIVFVFSLWGLSVSVMGQDVNQVDSKGLRQGKWTASYPNGTKRYEGQFEEGRCVGTFTYYDEDGRLKATNEFDTSGEKALNKTYSSNGRLIATGYYLNRKKDGEWRYYTEKTGKLMLTEEYGNDKLNGWVRIYNPDTERVAEETQYVDGKREGQGKQYFDTGLLLSEFQYHNDKLNGPAKTYYPNTVLKEEGNYLDGSRNGIWKTYNEDGELIHTDTYGGMDAMP
ncbi:MAG: toxin-antitoxin system YwqK family antitoxin [Candidatus Limimorpha sp.]